MTFTRRHLFATAVGGLTASLLAGSLAFAQDQIQAGIVVKIGGIPWFNAMEQGIKQQADADGIEAWMVGPTQADLSLIHISEPTRLSLVSRMPSSA